MKVLVADDDPVARRLLESTLVKLGHEVVTVTDGLTAESVLNGPDAPRLALLDWMMPGADGLAVCRAMRQRSGPYVYIILVTGKHRQEDMLTGFEAQADDFISKPVNQLELMARVRAGERVLDLQERLRAEATHDRLTGLWNRGAILDELERERQRTAREGRPLSVALADIDYFKRINDTYGHLTGDHVLQEAARRMKDVMRNYDAIGRYGGEEFLMILPSSDRTTVTQVAERVRLVVQAEPIRAGDIVAPATVSVGVAWTDQADLPAIALIHAADEALYRAKANGRNRVEGAPNLQTIVEPITIH